MTGEREISDAYRKWRRDTDASTSRILKKLKCHHLAVGSLVSVVIGDSLFQGQVWATGKIKLSKHNQLYISVSAKENWIDGKARRLDISHNLWRKK